MLFFKFSTKPNCLTHFPTPIVIIAEGMTINLVISYS